MLTRRRLAVTAAQSAAFGVLLRSWQARADVPAGTPPATPLDALFAQFAQEMLVRAPERATSLGLDVGKLAPLRGELHQGSLAAIAQDKQDNARRLAQLQAIGRRGLSGLQAANYDTVLFSLQIDDEAGRLFNYGTGGARSPYVLNQLTGAYQSVPDFLDTQHPIKTAADAQAYLARLEAFVRLMDQELEVFHHDAARQVVPPDFILDKTLVQMGLFLATPADKATIVTSLARRAAAAKLPGDFASQAGTIYTGKIIPALQRQADALKQARAGAVHSAGVGGLPKGADFYRLGLKTYTTASLTPADIHQTGLELVTSLSAQIDTALRRQGMKDGTVGARLAALAADKRYVYDDTDEAKQQLIADLNQRVAVMQAKLPERFDTLPKVTVQIRRVPKAIEAGAPGGYYQRGALDGSRPGAYYINLRDTAEWPRWTLSTLTYHEAIPGHHLQISLAQETPGLPLIRKMGGFSGYSEGWALYAEQLAVEMGMYDNDPLGHIGQLQAALFRAVRLVVDSGLHAQNWSREKAVDYYVDALGEKRSAAITEVERYCVWPGQACSYMIGKLAWLRLREQAKAALGERFDIKKFHDAGLLSGGLPLDVLDRVIGEYVAASQ
jgi:uncharacterized protein (DUF885 family)